VFGVSLLLLQSDSHQRYCCGTSVLLLVLSLICLCFAALSDAGSLLVRCWFARVSFMIHGLFIVRLLLVWCWFAVGSLLIPCWFTVVHCWFVLGSRLVQGWFIAGSLVVHGWFAGGSMVVHGWFAVGLLLVCSYFQLTNINVAAVLRLFCCLFFL
jgi:hypothetical protein